MLKIGDKVICINDTDECCLTIDKVYELYRIIYKEKNMYDKSFIFYRVVDDDGDLVFINSEHFIGISEHRNEVIDGILNL